MDRLEAMSILVSVVEAGSLSAASRRLNIPLPTVSRKLAELEQHVGTRLLTRSTRRLALTDAGSTYVAACRRILDAVGEAERSAAGEHIAPKGELVVAAPIVFGRLHVLPVVSDFLAAFPEINVRLVLSDRNMDLLDDHIDVAVRIGVLTDSATIATRIGAVRWVICGSPDCFAKHGVPESPQALAALPCVTFAANSAPVSWTFAGGAKTRAKDHVMSVRSRLSVNTAEAALDAAMAGVGVARVLSYQAAQAVENGSLRVVLQAFEPAPLPVHLIHATQGTLPLKLRCFLDFAAPHLRARILASLPA